jgi:hypothetical protein
MDTPNTTDDTLLTVSEAGRRFRPQLGPDRVRRLADEGKLHALRTSSGMRLFRASEVERFAAERRSHRSRGNDFTR